MVKAESRSYEIDLNRFMLARCLSNDRGACVIKGGLRFINAADESVDQLMRRFEEVFHLVQLRLPSEESKRIIWSKRKTKHSRRRNIQISVEESFSV